MRRPCKCIVALIGTFVFAIFVVSPFFGVKRWPSQGRRRVRSSRWRRCGRGFFSERRCYRNHAHRMGDSGKGWRGRWLRWILWHGHQILTCWTFFDGPLKQTACNWHTRHFNFFNDLPSFMIRDMVWMDDYHAQSYDIIWMKRWWCTCWPVLLSKWWKNSSSNFVLWEFHRNEVSFDVTRRIEFATRSSAILALKILFCPLFQNNLNSLIFNKPRIKLQQLKSIFAKFWDTFWQFWTDLKPEK